MQIAMSYYHVNNEDKKMVNEKFFVIDEVRDCKQLFDMLEQTISFSWDAMYELAKKYFEENKNLNVPSDYVVDGIWLNKWISEQKQIYYENRKNKSLSNDQNLRLESIGMDWRSNSEIAWDNKYSELLKLYKKYGSLEQAVSNSDSISNWIARQHKAYREKTIQR